MNHTFVTRLKTFFSSYFSLIGLYILFGFILILINEFLYEIDFQNYNENGTKELLAKSKLRAFLSIVIIGPIVEEFMFRTLIRPSQNDILLFIIAWLIGCISITITINLVWYYLILTFLTIFVLLFYLLKKLIRPSFLDKIINWLNRNTIMMLQITSVVFGLLHIFNYVDSFTIDNILFLMIVPRIIAGHMFGILKLKNKNILWPIGLHAMNNGVVFLFICTRF